MPRSTGPRKQYTQETLQEAILAVKSKKMTARKASIHFGVPETTLCDRVNGKYSSNSVSRTGLSFEEEEKLAAWLLCCGNRGCGKTRGELCLQAQKILKDRESEGRKNYFKDNKPGRKWCRMFMNRHPELMEKKAFGFDVLKTGGLSKKKIMDWFTTVEMDFINVGIEITSFSASRIFNVDEMEFPCVHGKNEVNSDPEVKHLYGVESTHGNKTSITVVGCACGDGSVLRPTMLYPGSVWTFCPEKVFPGADYVLTPNGQTNSESFMRWLKITFLPHVKPLLNDGIDPVILFVDGSQSLITLDVYDFCLENNIIFYVLPSSISHIVQPMYLILYGMLKEEWKREAKEYNSLVAAVGKETFLTVFASAWESACQKEITVNAFRASGISPWNSQAYNGCESSLGARTIKASDAHGNANIIVASGRPALSSCSQSDVLLHDLSNGSNSFNGTIASNNEPVDAFPAEQWNDLKMNFDFELEEDHKPMAGFHISSNNDDSVSSSCARELDVHAAEGISHTDAATLSPMANRHSLPTSDQTWNSLDIAYKVTKLIEHIIETGWSTAVFWQILQRQFCNIPPKPDETVYAKYLELWNAVVPPLVYDDEDEENEEAENSPYITFNVTKLVEHIMDTGWSNADFWQVQRRHFSNIPPKPDETDYAKYIELWNAVVPPPVFDDIPVPPRRQNNKKREKRKADKERKKKKKIKLFEDKKLDTDNMKKKKGGGHESTLMSIKTEVIEGSEPFHLECDAVVDLKNSEETEVGMDV